MSKGTKQIRMGKVYRFRDTLTLKQKSLKDVIESGELSNIEKYKGKLEQITQTIEQLDKWFDIEGGE